MDAVFFIIYASFRKSDCHEGVLKDILIKSKIRNDRLQITGVLLYNDEMFVQVLEGEKSIVMDLYDEIVLDKRHSSPIVLDQGMASKRLFPEWHMAQKQLDWESLEFSSPIDEVIRTKFTYLLNGKEGGRVIDNIARAMV